MSDQEVNDKEISDVESDDETIWDKIMWETYVEHKHVLGAIPSSKRKELFKKYFLDQVKKWMPMLQNFMENDRTKEAIWNAKEKIDYDSSEDEDDDEALLVAVDQLRYKIWKIIDWSSLKTWINNPEDSNDDDEDDATA